MTILRSTNQNPQPNAWLESCKTVGTGLLIALGIRAIVAEAVYIPSESMTPSLQIGDHLIVDKVSYRFHAPQRGDIVVFQPPEALTEQNIYDNLIKRIVGVPGDIVLIRNGRTYVNGREVIEAYVESRANYNYGPTQVPNQSYFVLGDNRNHSYDSHLWGFVPQQNIVGHAILRFSPITRMGWLRD